MKIDHLPQLDGEVYYEDHQDGHALTIYWKTNKKWWQFWKAPYKSNFFWYKQSDGSYCDELTTSQGTYNYDGKAWIKHKKLCQYCEDEVVVGSVCQMCRSLIDEAKKNA